MALQTAQGVSSSSSRYADLYGGKRLSAFACFDTISIIIIPTVYLSWLKGWSRKFAVRQSPAGPHYRLIPGAGASQPLLASETCLPSLSPPLLPSLVCLSLKGESRGRPKPLCFAQQVPLPPWGSILPHPTIWQEADAHLIMVRLDVAGKDI